MRARGARVFSQVPEGMLHLAAGCFQALSDPTRLKILRALKDGEQTVGDLVAHFTSTQPNISRHLSVLTKSGLVAKRKKGAYVYYRVANPHVLRLCETICTHVLRTIEDYSKER